MKRLTLKIKQFSTKLKEDYVSEFSAECAYYTILSFFPFVIFFITLIQFTIIDKQLILELIKMILPSSMHIFVFEIIEEIYSKSINTISISLIIALWSASRGFYSLCKGLKSVYKVSAYKYNLIIRIEGFIYTFLFIFGLIIAMTLIVFGNRIHNFIVQNFFYLGKITSFILRIRAIITIIILFFVFLLLYKFIPRHKMNLKTQVPGAIFSAVGWIIVSFIFSIYINFFKGFSNTYGSLSSIILIMMWIYVCIYMILIGAEINVFIYKKQKKIKKF